MLHHQERSEWNKLLLKALLLPLFLASIRSPLFALGKNCFIDHKLRLAPRRRFCYNRERWNINIIPPHSKCTTVWLRTVSGEYFMLMICAALPYLQQKWKAEISEISTYSFFPFHPPPLTRSSAIRQTQRAEASRCTF